MCVDPKRCQRMRLKKDKKIWTDSEKNWTLFNIHTSDKLEVFFDHSILVNAPLMALTYGVYNVFLAALTMKTVYTVYECCVYKNRVIEWILAPRNTRFISIHE